MIIIFGVNIEYLPVYIIYDNGHNFDVSEQISDTSFLV